MPTPEAMQENLPPPPQTNLQRAARHVVSTPAVFALPLAFGVFALIATLQGEKQFCCDARGYWDLSQTFTHHGSFSLLSFENTGLRGYALPLTYYVLRGIGGVLTSNDSWLVVVYNAVLFSLIGTVLVPRLAHITWPHLQWGIARRLLLCLLILVFWRGYLGFPLSDFPALVAVLLALIAISSPESPAWMLVGGLAAGLAMNMRPAYLLLVPILAVLMIWDWLAQRPLGQAAHARHVSGIALFAIGLLVVCVPQSLSQHRNFGSYDPIPGGGYLAGLQYTEGLKLQRYETFVGGTPQQARMMYRDPDSQDIVDKLENERVSGTGEYFEIAAKHPFTMAGVFLRHLINGLDHRYSTPYVEQLENHWNLVWRFAGFLLIFLALVRVLWPAARRSLEPARWRFPAVLLLISITSLPSAVETRFLLPVFILSCMLVLAPGWVSPLGAPGQGLKRYTNIAVLAGTGSLFSVLAWVVVSGATENLRLGG